MKLDVARPESRCSALAAALPLIMTVGLPWPCADGVPQVKHQLNVHGPKDDQRNPDAASPEQVARLYSAVLGRPVDEHGAAHYQSGKGYGMAQVADELLNSNEFRSKYSQSVIETKSIPVEYAQAAMLAEVLSGDVRVTDLDVWYLYSRLFDRPPDETALAGYRPDIEAKSLAVIDMIRDMMRSDEFVISFLYQRILGRRPDEDGKRHYATGLSTVQIAHELLLSQEFTERAGTAAEAVGVNASSGKPLMWAQAAEFCDELSHLAATPADVRYLYNKLLGHMPDDATIERHREPVNVLTLVVNILRSDEFVSSLDDLTGSGLARAQSAGYLALVGMTKTDMQAAARLDPASADAAYTASLLCTRAAINENLAQDWTSDLDMERLAGYFIQSARPSDEAYMVPGENGGEPSMSKSFAPTAVDYARASSALARHEGV